MKEHYFQIILLLLSVTLWQHQAVCGTNSKRTRFKSSLALANMVPTIHHDDLLISQSPTTINECSLLCFNNNDCSLFSFDPEHSSCKSFKTLLGDGETLTGVPRSGTMNFVEIMEDAVKDTVTTTTTTTTITKTPYTTATTATTTKPPLSPDPT